MSIIDALNAKPQSREGGHVYGLSLALFTTLKPKAPYRRNGLGLWRMHSLYYILLTNEDLTENK
jgi:hypothetical protein